MPRYIHDSPSLTKAWGIMTVVEQPNGHYYVSVTGPGWVGGKEPMTPSIESPEWLPARLRDGWRMLVDSRVALPRGV